MRLLARLTVVLGLVAASGALGWHLTSLLATWPQSPPPYSIQSSEPASGAAVAPSPCVRPCVPSTQAGTHPSAESAAVPSPLPSPTPSAIPESPQSRPNTVYSSVTRPWSEAQCRWAIDILTLDARLDQEAARSVPSDGDMMVYSRAATAWRIIGEMAASICGLERPRDPLSPAWFYRSEQADRLSPQGCRYADDSLREAYGVHRRLYEQGKDQGWHATWAGAYAALLSYFRAVC